MSLTEPSSVNASGGVEFEAESCRRFWISLTFLDVLLFRSSGFKDRLCLPPVEKAGSAIFFTFDHRRPFPLKKKTYNIHSVTDFSLLDQKFTESNFCFPDSSCGKVETTRYRNSTGCS